MKQNLIAFANDEVFEDLLSHSLYSNEDLAMLGFQNLAFPLEETDSKYWLIVLREKDRAEYMEYPGGFEDASSIVKDDAS